MAAHRERADVDRLEAQIRCECHRGFLRIRVVAGDGHHQLPVRIFCVRHVVRAGGVERLHDARALREPRHRLAGGIREAQRKLEIGGERIGGVNHDLAGK